MRVQMPYEELQEHMRRSTFCLLPPGGTASSRRLTDVVLSGCIPVFIGPPWHAMPLARHLNYTAFAVFVNVQSMRYVLPPDQKDAHVRCLGLDRLAAQFTHDRLREAAY